MSSFIKSSFLDDFEIPEITHDNIKTNLIKLNRSHNVIKEKSIENLSLDDKLKLIREEVYRVLGKYKGFVNIIYNADDLETYLDFAIKKGVIALDTETNKSKNPLTCKIMGLCLYVPNTRPVYVPLSHTIPGTDTLLKNQVSYEDASRLMQKLKDSDIKIIYHNGKFDIRVVYNTLGVYLPIWWDTMLAAQMIDENDIAKLKNQYQKYINPTMDTYDIEKLFNGIPYEWVDIDVFALYSAIDAYDTYKLQQYQENLFNDASMTKMRDLFLNTEVPVTEVVARMEDTGVTLNKTFVDKLNLKYKKNLDKATKKLDDLLKPYESRIKELQLVGELDSPVNYSSSVQLQKVLYDVMHTVPIDDKKATDKNTLKMLDTPFTRALLEQRHFSKLISSFTATLPTLVSPKDNKIHANFNQMGKEENNVRTGRFSSTNPNLQQIPSHEKTMRLMFEASPGYCFVGSDFSQQEPRLLTHMCQDKNLINTYNNKRDLYATIGSFVFHKDYWECMEHWEDGSPNPTGKGIRSKCKQIVLGTMYGMGAKLLATMLEIDVEECKNILNEFFKMFPTVKNFILNNEKMAKEQGYVEDYLGRRRHLPDAQLKEIELKGLQKVYVNNDLFFNKITDDGYITIEDKHLTTQWETYLQEKFEEGFKSFKAKEKFKMDAKANGLMVKDNGAFISKAMTQATNARIQGGAASLTKKAMVKIFNDNRLTELGFRILIPVHDELLGECPIENAKEVAKLLSQDMIDAAKPECSVNMKCDTYMVHYWYSDEVENQLHEDFTTLINGDAKKGIAPISEQEALSILSEKYSELSHDTLVSMCNGNFDHLNGHL